MGIVFSTGHFADGRRRIDVNREPPRLSAPHVASKAVIDTVLFSF